MVNTKKKYNSNFKWFVVKPLNMFQMQLVCNIALYFTESIYAYVC